ncbi:MAG TPA: D-Ala-D-Ala carboxypeptidase family metallohydrolase, partial [Myxococcaceae bacterium]|nr:D-Ala-D-Ala carboxypeptidase family metallohydrolase [Myxococcaceae bacterium]
MSSIRRRRRPSHSALLFLVAALLMLAQYAMAASAAARPAEAPAADEAEKSLPAKLLSRGLSGALRAVIVPPGESLRPHVSVREVLKQKLRWLLLGAGKAAPSADPSEGLKAPRQPGIWMLAPEGEEVEDDAPAIITPIHFDGSSRHLNGYHIGRYPAREDGRTGRYAPPEFFIEVTPRNQDFAVSKHFRLQQFLTKDQLDVWPKYLALDLRLVDKLELVLQELRAMGYPAKKLHVMSGFRTPQYNGPGGKGRAKFSRHTYGDAADVWLDDDGDGRMDDLDRNGRIDVEDARVLAQAVERVEERHPELVGGYGIYPSNRAHGPFVHIDVRGTPARWG